MTRGAELIHTGRHAGVDRDAGRLDRSRFNVASAGGPKIARTNYETCVVTADSQFTPECLESLEPGITLNSGGSLAGPPHFAGNLISFGFDGEQGRHRTCPPVSLLGIRCLPFAPTDGRTGSTDASD